MRKSLFLGLILSLALCVVGMVPASAVQTATTDGFALQVTPSPLIATLKPGETRELELKLRNGSLSALDLSIEVRSFRFDDATGNVKIDKTAPRYATEWVSFSAPNFTIQPSQWYTQKVKIALPKDTGFSYYFALLINQKEQNALSKGQRLQGSVAVFALINVDRPGATKKIDFLSLKSTQSIYEFLPAEFSIQLKNSGNTIVQPYGNVYIYPGEHAAGEPIATMPLNESQAHLLPDSQRSLSASWQDGFPVFTTQTNDSGASKTSLKWNWDKLGQFRFGRYTAKVVAVYHDGTRDVPITKEITFWVIPWKSMLLILVVIVGIFLLLRLYIKKRTEKAVKKALAKRSALDD